MSSRSLPGYEPVGPSADVEPSAADHPRAARFVREWLSAPYDPNQHPEWLNLARAYAHLARQSEGDAP